MPRPILAWLRALPDRFFGSPGSYDRLAPDWGALSDERVAAAAAAAAADDGDNDADAVDRGKTVSSVSEDWHC